jgi:hypothetical protein
LAMLRRRVRCGLCGRPTEQQPGQALCGGGRTRMLAARRASPLGLQEPTAAFACPACVVLDSFHEVLTDDQVHRGLPVR